jgi:D-hydroxyproline dehydrogenase subunit alpha
MHSHEHDVVVVGAGPAGIAAACAARESGLAVAVVDDNPSAGGQIWRGGIPSPWRERFQQEVIADMRVVGLIEPGVLLAESAAEALALRYRKLILAPGARELLLPFPGWTLPNVVAAGGLQALVKGGLPIEDKRVVVAGSGPLLLAVAMFLRKHGARVRAFYGQRYGGCRPVAAEGDGKVEAVVLRRGRNTWREPCDYLACSFGLVANLELPLLLGCALRNRSIMVNEWQETSIAGVYYAGQPGGVGLALAEGEIAGYACAGRTGDARRHFGARARAQWFKAALDWAFPLRDESRSLAAPDTIVCRCEDVTMSALAHHQGWRSAKLETRCGMGPCQGRICGAAIEFLLGWNPESVRPPIFPVRAETLAAIHWKQS